LAQIPTPAPACIPTGIRAGEERNGSARAGRP